MILSGIIGLFLGAVILALGYKLFETWINQSEPSDVSERAESAGQET